MLRILEPREKLACLELTTELSDSDAKDGRSAQGPTGETAWSPETTEVPETKGPADADLVVQLAPAAPSRGRTAQLLRARMAEALRQETESNSASA